MCSAAWAGQAVRSMGAGERTDLMVPDEASYGPRHHTKNRGPIPFPEPQNLGKVKTIYDMRPNPTAVSMTFLQKGVVLG